MKKTNKSQGIAPATYRYHDPISGELVYELAVTRKNAKLIEMLRADDERVRKQDNWAERYISKPKPTDIESDEASSDDQLLDFPDWTYSPEFVLFASDEPDSFDAQTLDKLEALHAAVKQLTEAQQTLIRQFFGQRMTMSQIARLEGSTCTPQAIYNRISKIKARLRKLL